MNTPHVHVEHIKKWADNPKSPVYFFDVHDRRWEPILGTTVNWDPDTIYHVGEHPPLLKVIRRRSEVVIPQPVHKTTFEFGLGGDYVPIYVPDLSAEGYRKIEPYEPIDPIFIQKGLIFDTPEAAIKALQVMLEGFTK